MLSLSLPLSLSPSLPFSRSLVLIPGRQDRIDLHILPGRVWRE